MYASAPVAAPDARIKPCREAASARMNCQASEPPKWHDIMLRFSVFIRPTLGDFCGGWGETSPAERAGGIHRDKACPAGDQFRCLPGELVPDATSP